jgi:TonB-dependent starch-binding outer membrane protein SusC
MKKLRILAGPARKWEKNLLKMKLTVTLFLVSLITVSASTYSQNTRFDIRMNGKNIIELFKEIEAKGNFYFFYQKEELKDLNSVTVSRKNANVIEILDEVLEGTGLAYKVIDRYVIVTRSENLGEMERATFSQQQNAVSGRVTDKTGAPLPGVTVVVKGTTVGTITDNSGNYVISNITSSSVLVYSFVGMRTLELQVGSQTTINVTLQEETIGIEEVVAIGYGTVRKSDLTGSIVSIGADQIIQGPATSASRAIQGKAAGVRVTQRTGRPGDDVIIRIRGGNSLSGGNDPLYVIDGFPVDRLGADFNPEDIASLEILKDASATAIYGSRGANGVVLITTKRGSEGKGTVSYHGYYGVQNLRKKIDLLDKNEYVAMQNEIAAKEGGNILTPAQIAALPDNDWQDLAYRNAIMQNHQISASGGSNTARFYTSLNFMEQEGILKGSDYNRISMRVNGDIMATTRLNVKANIAISRALDNNGNFAADGWGAIPFQSIVMPPTVPIFDESGKYTVFRGTPWGGTNPVGFAAMDKNTTTLNRVISNVDASYNILEGLDLKVSAGVDFNNSTTDTYRKIGIVDGGTGTGTGSKAMSKSYTFINENILNYTRTLNQIHRLSALAGFSYQESVFDNISSGSYSGFVSDIFENNNLQSAKNTRPVSTGYNDSRLISYIGRFNYVYKEKYLLTLTGRYDGSSKFGANNKYAFFPSAALAWRISEEEFMRDVDWISNLKLRASYGEAGNQAISPYQTLDRLTTNVPVFGSGERVGFVASGFSNQGLRWETTAQTDIGIDVGVFENRIGLVLDYYKKNTTDLLYNASLPPSSGYSSSIRNVGEIENKGFEFELSYRNLEGAVRWNSSLNMSFNRGKVVDLGKDNNGNIITRIDSPMGGGNWFPLFLNESPSQLYGFIIEGIYESDAEAAKEPGKKAGDYKIKDFSKDGLITGDDQTMLTHLEPKFIFGMNNELSYMNFKFSFLLVGSYGNDIVNEFNKYYTALGGTWNVTKEAWNNRWTGPGSGGKYAAASSNSPSYITFGAPSTLWVEDGSYIRVKDIKLSYSIPATLADRLKIANATLYVSGTNLITFTNYPHYDPEASWTSSAVNGWDRGVYPSSKSVLGGIQVTF